MKYQIFVTLLLSVRLFSLSLSLILTLCTYKVVHIAEVTTQLSLTMDPAQEKYPSPYNLTWNKCTSDVTGTSVPT